MTNDNPAQIVIREAIESDLPMISRLSRQLGYPVSKRDLASRFLDLNSHSDHQIWVAQLNSTSSTKGKSNMTVVGFMHLRVVHDLIEVHGLEVAVLVVDERHRGLGVGSQLLGLADQCVRKLKLPILFLRSNVKRKRAHQFYLREGFVQDVTSQAFVKSTKRVR
jgi:GNAT superfamily N-acetyltransferase